MTYTWTDNPTISGIATCDTDVLNDCLMNLKYESASERNIGEIVQSTIPLTDAGLHLADGSLLAYGSYKEFIDYIADIYNSSLNYFCSEADWQTSVTTYGSCGKFVYDSVNKTVRLPKVSDILTGITDVSALGSLVEAGLPNITGTSSCFQADYWRRSGGEATGAFRSSLRTGGTDGNDDQDTCGQDTFNASWSNPIYGNSNTVQPQTIKALLYIVIANTTKTAIEVDIDEIATDLNGKADTDLVNVNDSGTSRGAGWALPSNTYEDLTLGASGATYTAPANGRFQCLGAGASSNDISNIVFWTKDNQNTTYLTSSRIVTYGNYGVALIGGDFEVKKGDVVGIDYFSTTFSSGGYTNLGLKFIYAKGSESEAS